MVASVWMLAAGLKSNPMDLSLAAEGAFLFAVAGLNFPQPRHPMHRLIGRILPNRTWARNAGTAAPKPTPSGEEAAMIRDMIAFNREAMNYQPRKLPHHAGACRLEPIIGPSGEASSWIGGLPRMPADVRWPETDGRPSVFLAQISLADLPANVWNGLGPRGGWLLFFCEPLKFDAASVLHVRELGPERPYPENSALGDVLSYDARKSLEVLGRSPDSFVPTRWALRVTPLAPGAEAQSAHVAEAGANPDPRDDLMTADLSSIPLRPVDPDAALALVAALHDAVSGQQRSAFGPRRGTPEGDAWSAHLEAAQHEIDGLREKARAGIDADDLLLAVDRIAAGQVTGSGMAKPILGGDIWKGAYRGAVELLARETYGRDPAALPPETRSAFETIWRFDAACAPATVGGSVPEGYTYTAPREPVLLLQLEPTRLTGWLVGDLDTFGVFIAPADLKAGRWRKAWGDIIIK